MNKINKIEAGYLCIGGPEDGKIMSAMACPIMKLPVYPPRRDIIKEPSDIIEENETITYKQYHLDHRLGSVKIEGTLWVWENIKEDSILDRVLSRFKLDKLINMR